MIRHIARMATVLAISTGLIVSAGGCAPTPPAPDTAPRGNAAQVARVIDGDTIVLTDDTRVRVLGIDTPELHPKQCGGTQARDFTRAALPAGSEVVLTADFTQDDRDRYGRLLRYVTTPAGTDLGHELLAAGWAKVYIYQGRAVTKIEDYQAAESRAGAQGAGIWGNTCAE